MDSRIVSGWRYLFGGTALGFALGLLAAPRLLGLEAPDEEEGPGLGKRLLDKIPGKVKLAGAVGAVKGASGEAYREYRQSREESRRGADR